MAPSPVNPDSAGSTDSFRTTVARSFSDAFDSEASGVWSAPGRVNLIGEHTDYNAGLCLPIALPHRTFAAVRPRTDRWLRLASMQSPEQYELKLDDVRAGYPPGWGAYAAGVVWALQDAGHQVRGLDLMVDGQVPQGAGLSSSAALECAVAAELESPAPWGTCPSTMRSRPRTWWPASCRAHTTPAAYAPQPGGYPARTSSS